MDYISVYSRSLDKSRGLHKSRVKLLCSVIFNLGQVTLSNVLWLMWSFHVPAEKEGLSVSCCCFNVVMWHLDGSSLHDDWRDNDQVKADSSGSGNHRSRIIVGVCNRFPFMSGIKHESGRLELRTDIQTTTESTSGWNVCWFRFYSDRWSHEICLNGCVTAAQERLQSRTLKKY